MSHMNRRTPRLISLATAYADQSEEQDEEFVIPENFADLPDAELAELADAAAAHFETIYGDGTDVTDEQYVFLESLTVGIEQLASEQETRELAAEERREKAAALAARVNRREDAEEAAEESDEEDEAESGDPEEVVDAEAEDEDETEDENAAQTVTASASSRRSVRVPMSALRGRSKASAPKPSDDAMGIKDVLVASGEGLGYAVNQGIDWLQAGEALDKRLSTYNATAYTNAARMGRPMREQGSLVSIRRPIPDNLTIKSNDQAHVDSVLDFATSEKNLPQGNLVASGGWCAPSETLYDLIEMESRDGLISLPEIGITRGGVQFTKGPSFSEIFQDIEGFHFTEADDVAGRYARDEEGNAIVGAKPCYKVDCPDFEEHRLDVEGLCITAGLLASRGYPEYLARILRGALVAHEHRLNGRILGQMEDGSTEVTMPSVQAGAAAPILTSIELQVEHYKYTHRLARGTTLEAVFPFWVRGAIRADLARRQGTDLLAVTDAQITSWFASRGVSAQFVYNWQAIDGTAPGSFTAYPNELKFQLYTAGTWIRGAAPLITLDTLYDSSLTQTNDYTALFTEEGYFVAKRGLDARVVGLTYSADGATHEGIAIEHNGTVGA